VKKRYNEIAPELLAIASDQEINDLVELEVAIKGIEPVVEPVEIPNPAVSLKPTTTGYKVGSLVFATEAKAKQVAEMATLKEDYDYYASSEHKYIEPHTYSIEVNKYYNKAEVQTNAAALKEYKKKSEESETKRKEYAAYMETISKVSQSVWNKVHEARQEQH
jgi:hypothetical protein